MGVGNRELTSPRKRYPMKEIDEYRLVFIGGLHRSGTSPLHRCLQTHPDISCFENTGVPEDEGQHLQSVYPTAAEFGGAGRFGFVPDAHMTEDSELVTADRREKLFFEWSRYWDPSKSVLVEKSPPNIIRSRFLQALFPNSRFIFIIRHPIPTALTTMRRARTSLTSGIEHWIQCHELLINDLKILNRYFLLRYEDFVDDPDSYMEDIAKFIGLDATIKAKNIEKHINDKYFDQWEKHKTPPSRAKVIFERARNIFPRHTISIRSDREIEDIERRFETSINRFGYSFHNYGRSGCSGELNISAPYTRS